MNIEYVRGLRDYFAKLKPEQIDQRRSIYYAKRSDSPPCGSFGVHSAIFNNSAGYNHLLGDKFFSYVSGMFYDEKNGLTRETLREAYRNIGGRNDPFYPYWKDDWGVPVVAVLDEVIRMHEQEEE